MEPNIQEIFVPHKMQDAHVCEVDPNFVFAHVCDGQESPKLIEYQHDGKTYKVNVASDRLNVLLKSRFCACCGIVGNKMYLDYIVEPSNPEFKDGYHFNLYAECGKFNQNKKYLTLMTKDHIVPRRLGGADDFSNFQTLCHTCNCLKDIWDLPIESIRSGLFLAYRAYSSSVALSKSKENLAWFYQQIKVNEGSIRNIELNLNSAPEHARSNMLRRRDKIIRNMPLLQEAIKQLELKSQVSGVILTVEEVNKVKQELITRFQNDSL